VVFGELRWKMTNRLIGRINGRFSRYKTDVDASAFTDDDDFTSTSKNWQAGAGMTYRLKSGNINLNYLYNDVTRTYTDDSTDRSNSFAYYSNSRYEGKTNFAELYGNYKWKRVELLAGIDYRRNKTNQDYYS